METTPHLMCQSAMKKLIDGNLKHGATTTIKPNVAARAKSAEREVGSREKSLKRHEKIVDHRQT